MSTLQRVGLAISLAATVALCPVNSSRADAEAEAVPQDSAPVVGTLHKASAREWLEASTQNQLATASDWVMASKELKAKVAETGDMSVATARADKLRQCINGALRRHSQLYAEVRAADIAMTCMITLKY